MCAWFYFIFIFMSLFPTNNSYLDSLVCEHELDLYHDKQKYIQQIRVPFAAVGYTVKFC